MPTPEEIIKEGEKQVEEAETPSEETVGEEEQEEEENPEEDESRPVASSMVAEIGYERQSEELMVTFNNGKAESYPCSPAQWAAAKEAESVGKFMHQEFL